MAATAATAGGEVRAAHARDEADLWGLPYSKLGVPVEDADGGDKSDTEVIDGRAAAYAVAWRGEAETASGGVGRAAAVARGGGKAGAGAGTAGGDRRSSPRLRGRSLDDGEGNSVQFRRGVPARRKRKVTVTPSNLQPPEVQPQDEIGEAQYLPASVEDVKRVYKENENLRLQLALKTKELEREENKRLKLELALKEKEMESLQKQHEELKAENENLKKTAKPPKRERFCNFCQTYQFHDSRNCPKRLGAANSSEGNEEENSV
ncbi:hypothetical protein ACP4OV_022322 [Aristida adscensionis]